VRISAQGEMDGELLCTHGSPWAESDAVEEEEEEEEEYVAEVDVAEVAEGAEVDVAEVAVRSGGGEGAVRPLEIGRARNRARGGVSLRKAL